MTPRSSAGPRRRTTSSCSPASASYILNSISAYRSAQKDVPEVAKDVFFTPALKGPRGTARACEHVIYITVVPKFAEKNADLAKQFLLDRCRELRPGHVGEQTVQLARLLQHRGAVRRPRISRGSEREASPGPPQCVVQQRPLRPSRRTDRQAAAAQGRGRMERQCRLPGPANPAEGEIFGTLCAPGHVRPRCPGQAERRGVRETSPQRSARRSSTNGGPRASWERNSRWLKLSSSE